MLVVQLMGCLAMAQKPALLFKGVFKPVTARLHTLFENGSTLRGGVGERCVEESCPPPPPKTDVEQNLKCLAEMAKQVHILQQENSNKLSVA